jgi:hypothetical protein
MLFTLGASITQTERTHSVSVSEMGIACGAGMVTLWASEFIRSAKA